MQPERHTALEIGTPESNLQVFKCEVYKHDDLRGYRVEVRDVSRCVGRRMPAGTFAFCQNSKKRIVVDKRSLNHFRSTDLWRKNAKHEVAHALLGDHECPEFYETMGHCSHFYEMCNVTGADKSRYVDESLLNI